MTRGLPHVSGSVSIDAAAAAVLTAHCPSPPDAIREKAAEGIRTLDLLHGNHAGLKRVRRQNQLFAGYLCRERPRLVAIDGPGYAPMRGVLGTFGPKFPRLSTPVQSGVRPIGRSVIDQLRIPIRVEREREREPGRGSWPEFRWWVRPSYRAVASSRLRRKITKLDR